jgi:putative transposon-encoded protein
MLQALEKLDPSRAASVLSLAARKFLPRPGDDHTPNQADQAAAEDVIRELSTKAASSRKPQTEVNTAAVQEALSREISSYLLGGVDSAEVRARVGEKGALSPSLYRVSFSLRFENSVTLWGLSKTYVVNAIAKCDQVQHFVSKIEAPNAPAHTSLFAQTPPVKHDPYTILVKCQRSGDMLIVDEAYRVYHDEVDLIGSSSALDILKRFIDRVGREVEIVILNPDETLSQPLERRKFFHDVMYHVPHGGFLINKFTNGDILRMGPAESDIPATVDLCFEVDNQKYADQLSRHGIKVDPKVRGRSYTMRNVRPRL